MKIIDRSIIFKKLIVQKTNNKQCTQSYFENKYKNKHKNVKK